MNGGYGPRPGSAGTRPGSSESVSRAAYAVPVPDTSDSYGWHQNEPRRPPPSAQAPKISRYNGFYEDERPPSSPSTLNMQDGYQEYRPYSQRSSSSLSAAPQLTYSQSCTYVCVSCDVLPDCVLQILVLDGLRPQTLQGHRPTRRVWTGILRIPTPRALRCLRPTLIAIQRSDRVQVLLWLHLSIAVIPEVPTFPRALMVAGPLGASFCRTDIPGGVIAAKLLASAGYVPSAIASRTHCIFVYMA